MTREKKIKVLKNISSGTETIDSIDGLFPVVSKINSFTRVSRITRNEVIKQGWWAPNVWDGETFKSKNDSNVYTYCEINKLFGANPKNLIWHQMTCDTVDIIGINEIIIHGVGHLGGKIIDKFSKEEKLSFIRVSHHNRESGNMLLIKHPYKIAFEMYERLCVNDRD